MISPCERKSHEHDKGAIISFSIPIFLFNIMIGISFINTYFSFSFTSWKGCNNGTQC